MLSHGQHVIMRQQSTLGQRRCPGSIKKQRHFLAMAFINKLFEKTQEQIKEEEEDFKESAKKQAKRLVEIKKKTKEKKSLPAEVEIVDDWELDYED